MPFLPIAIPVIHAAGGYIASAGGYIAGTKATTAIGAFILGNKTLVATGSLAVAAISKAISSKSE